LISLLNYQLKNEEFAKMNKCAAIQMTSSPNISANLVVAEKLIVEAVNKRAKLIALPENFAIMGNNHQDKIQAKEEDGSGVIQDFLANLAKKYQVWIIGGTLPLVAENANKMRAACLVYNAKGERVGRYDKIHLFDVSVPDTDEKYLESNTIEPGVESVIIDTPFGKIGLAICYDLRFPELLRQLVNKGAEIIIIPSAFTAETGATHWETLLRARAIENLCYVIAPNQGGFHLNGRKTFGHSMIIDPWGIILAHLKTGLGVVCANIDLQRLAKIRRHFPVLEHRRVC
jgi:nitrilase